MNNPTDDTRPDWLKENEVATGIIIFERNTYPYTIVDSILNLSLPGFVGFVAGKHLFVSDEVPSNWRNFILKHELYEFVKLAGQPGRCIQALLYELHLARTEFDREESNQEEFEKYVRYRRGFFQRLIAYYQDTGDDDFKAEIAASLRHLEKLCERFDTESSNN